MKLKEIDGDPHKQRIMRFNSKQREKPYQDLTSNECHRNVSVCLQTLRQVEFIPPSSSIHRLGRGLPGYLILFATHAFEPQRQLQSSKSPSPLVFLLISTHSTATLGIPLTSPALKLNSFRCSSAVKLRAFTSDLLCRLHSLYAQSFRTTLAPYVLPRLLARS